MHKMNSIEQTTIAFLPCVSNYLLSYDSLKTTKMFSVIFLYDLIVWFLHFNYGVTLSIYMYKRYIDIK